MENQEINIDKIVSHCISSSENDYKTMLHLFNSGDFHWSLFIGHLVIEKLLKAIIVKETKQHAPFTHDLRRLAKKSSLMFSPEYTKWLDIITTFNLNARYDDYKQEFFKKCTKDFTSQWIKNIQSLHLWIKQRL